MDPSSIPSTEELLTVGALVQLHDGSHVRIRPSRPDDQDLLRRGFERLSAESRYKRFLVPMPELTESMVRYLTEIDHHDHEAIVALDEESGEGVGVARYVRSPGRPDAAEAAVTVVDDWQGRGLGTVLLGVLTERAREEGISTFTALLLGTNAEMLDLLGRLDPVRVIDREQGTVEVEIALREVGLAPALGKLLRVIARSDIAVPLAERPSVKIS